MSVWHIGSTYKLLAKTKTTPPPHIPSLKSDLYKLLGNRNNYHFLYSP